MPLWLDFDCPQRCGLTLARQEDHEHPHSVRDCLIQSSLYGDYCGTAGSRIDLEDRSRSMLLWWTTIWPCCESCLFSNLQIAECTVVRWPLVKTTAHLITNTLYLGRSLHVPSSSCCCSTNKENSEAGDLMMDVAPAWVDSEWLLSLVFMHASDLVNPLCLA